MGHRRPRPTRRLVHSTRAKRNMTKQIYGIIDFLYADLASTIAQRNRISAYRKLPGYPAMRRAYDNDIAKTRRDIKQYVTLYNRYQKAGKVF